MSGKTSGKRTAILGICTLLVVSALAAPVVAYNNGTTTLPGNNAPPGISANLGVQGDVVIVCGWGEWDGNYGASVTPDAVGGPEVGAHVVVSGTNQPDICTGGAFGPFDVTQPGGVPNGDGFWYVVGQDYIVNGCKDTRADDWLTPQDSTNGDDLNLCTESTYEGLDDAAGTGLRLGKSMLARVQVEFTDEYNAASTNANANNDACASDPVPGTPCTFDTDFDVFRNVLQMGVCGAAYVPFTGTNDGDEVREDTNWDSKLVAGATAPASDEPSGTISNVIAEAQVFENGPLFYFANCVSSAGSVGTVKATFIGLYNTLTQDVVNEATCGGGDFTVIGLVCFFPFPGQEMDCSANQASGEGGSPQGGPTGDPGTTSVAFPAIVGEIAWSVDYSATAATGFGCQNDKRNADWQYFGGSEQGVNSGTGGLLTGVVSACATIGGSLSCGTAVNAPSGPGQVI